MLLLALRMIIAHIGASATLRRVRSRSTVVEVAFHEIVITSHTLDLCKSNVYIGRGAHTGDVNCGGYCSASAVTSPDVAALPHLSSIHCVCADPLVAQWRLIVLASRYICPTQPRTDDNVGSSVCSSRFCQPILINSIMSTF